MSSSKPVGRIWRGVDAPRVSAATFAVELPGGARSQAVSMVDTIEEARAEGYQRGYADARGEMEASAEGERQRRLAQVCDALSQAAGALVGRRAEAVAVAELEVVHLAVELAEAVVRRELALGRQPAVEALQRALSLVPTGEDLLVRLHPGDVLDAAELQALVPDRQVRVVADEAVEPGGCLVDAGPCHIDAQIGPALARARGVLAGLRPAVAAPIGVEGGADDGVDDHGTEEAS